MKKILVLMAGLGILSLPVAAQVSIAPEAGVSLANMHFQLGDKKLDDGLKIGGRGGVNVNIPITQDRLVLQPGLFYAVKGGKNEVEGTKNNYTLHYVEVPLNLQYMFNDPSEGRFFVGAGPYVAMAVNGKNLYHGAAGEGHDNLQFGSEPDQDFGRFDYGAGVNLGYLLRSGVFFRGAYQMSISNLKPSEMTQDYTIRNSAVSVTIGKQLSHAPRTKGPRMQGAYEY